MKIIDSTWIWQIGKWSDEISGYVDIKQGVEKKEIGMEIVVMKDEEEKQDFGRAILYFRGGPTGFESYYVESLKRTKFKSKYFCICAGTINDWPRCNVKVKDVLDYIEEWEKENA